MSFSELVAVRRKSERGPSLVVALLVLRLGYPFSPTFLLTWLEMQAIYKCPVYLEHVFGENKTLCRLVSLSGLAAVCGRKGVQ